MRAILNCSVKIWNMLTHSLLSWSLRSWYRTDVKLFGIRLYESYDIILLDWSDFKRKWDQVSEVVNKRWATWNKNWHLFEMRTSHVTSEKTLESSKNFCVIHPFLKKKIGIWYLYDKFRFSRTNVTTFRFSVCRDHIKSKIINLICSF